MVTTPFDQRKGAVPPRRPAVRIRGRYVRIISAWHLQPRRPSNHQIDLADVDTSVKLLAMIHQLSSKEWFDGGTLRALISVVSDHYGWKVTGR
jgi:hypothetical protein